MTFDDELLSTGEPGKRRGRTMARFGYWLAGSALILLPIWSAAAQTASDGPTPEAFRDPPAEARPGTFYHWMNGNVTAAGLDADLARSEEHTSELQSLMRTSYAVLTWKKKNK